MRCVIPQKEWPISMSAIHKIMLGKGHTDVMWAGRYEGISGGKSGWEETTGTLSARRSEVVSMGSGNGVVPG
jgi:hypothetical protein